MKYVLQKETEDGTVYKAAIYSTRPIPPSVTYFLSEARLFNGPGTAARFLRNSSFLRNYSVVPISEIELFKAKLART